MPLQFGSGLTLKDACPWLRDNAERHRRILDVVERNSVIEGSPPFTDDFRDRLQGELRKIAASGAAIPEDRDDIGPAENRPRM